MQYTIIIKDTGGGGVTCSPDPLGPIKHGDTVVFHSDDGDHAAEFTGESPFAIKKASGKKGKDNDEGPLAVTAQKPKQTRFKYNATVNGKTVDPEVVVDPYP